MHVMMKLEDFYGKSLPRNIQSMKNSMAMLVTLLNQLFGMKKKHCKIYSKVFFTLKQCNCTQSSHLHNQA